MPTKKPTNHKEIEPVQTTIVPTTATRELTPGVWNMIEKMAPVMYRAHLFKVTAPEQAAAIMLKGYELGLSLTASFEFIQVIDNKPTLAPRGALALLHSSPVIKEIKTKKLEEGGKFIGYECTMTRADNGFSHTARFTLDDAKRAGLTAGSSLGNGKVRQDQGNWEKYPENMCLWRAVGFCADVVAPDVTAGMTTLMKAPEMYGVALTEGGDVVDVTPQDVPNPTDWLNVLIQDWTAEKIMEVNEGKIPMTMEEIEAVRAKLEAAKQEA